MTRKIMDILVFGFVGIAFIWGAWIVSENQRLIEENSSNVYERAAASTVRVEKIGNRDAHGSGVVIRADGSILTAAHVCRMARSERDEVMIRRADGEQVIANIFWYTDSGADLCVVTVNPSDLSWVPIKIRDTPLRLGEDVFALGWPRQRGLAATKGIVSGLSATTNHPTWPRVQADLVILPGNSGGPLLDMRGNLVGINVQIAGFRMSGYMLWDGASYAIPVPYLRALGIT